MIQFNTSLLSPGGNSFDGDNNDDVVDQECSRGTWHRCDASSDDMFGSRVKERHCCTCFFVFFCLASYTSGVHHSPSYTSGVHHSPSYTSGVHHSPSYTSGVHHSPSYTSGVHHSPSYTSGVHHFGKTVCVCDHFSIQP